MSRRAPSDSSSLLCISSNPAWAICRLASAAAFVQHARNFSIVVEDWKRPCRYLIHDGDTSFAALDGVLKSDALHILKTPPYSPLRNAYAERHVREIRETLHQLILLGQPPRHNALSKIE